MAAPIISVRNVTKRYRLGTINMGSFRDELQSMFRRRREAAAAPKRPAEFLALDDVSFDVEKGQTLGLIGRNGAGKSTLLKILSRITEPTEGEVHLHGRLASLLEVGTGFHPELSGRENIFLNGAVLGMSKAEIAREVRRDRRHSPRSASSSTHRSSATRAEMYVRLAFAIAAHLDPEVLIVDEVLAVGDAEFQRKCIDKMESMRRTEGRTILFVSHSADVVSRLCSHCVLLERGTVRAVGPTQAVMAQYHGTAAAIRGPGRWISLSTAAHTGTQRAVFHRIRYQRIDEVSAPTLEADLIHPMSRLRFEIEIEALEALTVHSLALTIYGPDGAKLLNYDTVSKGMLVRLRPGTNSVEIRTGPIPLNSGTYGVGFGSSRTAERLRPTGSNPRSRWRLRRLPRKTPGTSRSATGTSTARSTLPPTANRRRACRTPDPTMRSISILMPVYNGARYLPAAVESVLTQTLTDFELVAVDDGSSDASLDILHRFERQDRRVRVLSRPNTGIVGALSDAVSVATAPLLGRLDADDVAAPERLERQVAYMAAHPECVALGTAAWIVDSDGAVVDRFAPPLSHADIERELLRGNGGALIHPSAVFRRSAFERAGGYDPAYCKAEDIDLYFRLIPEGLLANLPEALIRYRQHPQSANFTARSEQRRLVGRILEREAARRQIALAPQALAPSHADVDAAARHRLWACTSCRHGSGRTALKHALLALRESPAGRENWGVLHYVLGSLWHRATGTGTIPGAAPQP